LGSIEDEKARIHRLAAARAAKAEADGEDPVAAYLRASLDAGLADLGRNFGRLQGALGIDLDPGAFLMGMQCAAFAMSEVDAIEAAQHPIMGPLLREYVGKARAHLE
jgi:hypothetical protein